MLLEHDWRALLIFDRFNEHWPEGVLIHGLAVFSLMHVVAVFMDHRQRRHLKTKTKRVVILTAMGWLWV
jgi:hypothetical protein